MKGIFKRTELLLGGDIMNKIAATRVIIFGVGGVGSWCAESLVRSGVGHLTIVDSDRICVTNINRQLPATTKTVGRVKVEVLRERLLDINPSADINALQMIYSRENADFFQLDTFDYIIDAIDSLEHKVHLIQTATRTRAVFFSAMGAALKLTGSKIEVAEFWKVKGCPLARAIRKILNKSGDLPAKKFLCVYSEEVLTNKGKNASCGTAQCLCPKIDNGEGDPALATHEWCSLKAQINGTLAHTTAISGFMLAGLVVEDITKNED
ncbi:MAG: tRNA threonylcarbamoyladenosine dehydratase [Prevotellaceae bacterium]|jgi:tRNA A37 threonylcarbamoyladenosine dehydratase|nr:tRNA threonylcarbamoyladenosine dehydratase [Prevotellaceae bacterium]